ncbi:hypothetical protein F3Y22_tig00110283pilonHSYRG00109 [Hibiscus syriacus]|uniref:Reverse transcriptase zinc-binding domain-containing protein n=1 Tax=Hibiscus syriacus TaxID=106335 RepID=A0A6A3B8G0_HIBSY|nr:hypothetical protein F3Y22_tig00110283pilonHSYRG00109 [Hibiscus syriacus]
MKFFHVIASMRNRRNHISQIRFGNHLTSDPKLFSLNIEGHFQEIYNAIPTIPVKSFKGEMRRFCVESSNALEMPFSVEAWEAICASDGSRTPSPDGSRAPSPDGFNLDFFQEVLTPGIASKINKMTVKFTWGSSNNHSIDWIRWESITMPIECSGLGIYGVNVRNRSLLTSGNGDIVLNLIAYGGDGEAIDFWEDTCSGSVPLKLAIQLRRQLFEWEKALWQDFFKSNITGSKNINSTTADKMWKSVWAGVAPPKVEAFLWRAILERIPVKSELLR